MYTVNAWSLYVWADDHSVYVLSCVESRFLDPTGSQRVEVESPPNEDRVATDVPPNIIDTSVKVIKLGGVAVSHISLYIFL